MAYTKEPTHLNRRPSGRLLITGTREGKGKHTLFYRALMEAHLGRPLREDEVVHHINGDPSDDRIENLEVMTNAEHTALHRDELIAARWPHLTRGEWSSHGPCCAECGTTEKPHGGRGLCRSCYHRHWRQERKSIDSDGRAVD